MSGPDSVCNSTEWALSSSKSRYDHDHPQLHCLTRGQSIGLTVTTQAAFILLIAVLYLFARIIRNIRRCVRDLAVGKWSLVKGPADIYMLSLVIADLIQAIGTILDIKWVNEGKVYTGSYCALQQLGETPVAMNTLAIAVHTFVTVWWDKALHARLVALGVVTCIWVYTIAFVSVTLATQTKDPYMTPTPYWCWIGPASSGLRIWGVPMALGGSCFLLCSLRALFFWSRGNITVMDQWWKFKVHRKKVISDIYETTTAGLGDRRTRKRLALGMLAYPLTYSFMVLPLSVVRWISFDSDRSDDSKPVPSAWSFFVISIYGLSGCANVLLVLFTRPQLLLIGQPSTHPRRPRTPGTTDARPRRGQATLPSASPSPSPSPSRRSVNAWHDPDPTATDEEMAQRQPPHRILIPRVTVVDVEPPQSNEEYDPYRSNWEACPPALAHGQRVSMDGSRDGRGEGGLRDGR